MHKNRNVWHKILDRFGITFSEIKLVYRFWKYLWQIILLRLKTSFFFKFLKWFLLSFSYFLTPLFSNRIHFNYPGKFNILIEWWLFSNLFLFDFKILLFKWYKFYFVKVVHLVVFCIINKSQQSRWLLSEKVDGCEKN